MKANRINEDTVADGESGNQHEPDPGDRPQPREAGREHARQEPVYDDEPHPLRDHVEHIPHEVNEYEQQKENHKRESRDAQGDRRSAHPWRALAAETVERETVIIPFTQRYNTAVMLKTLLSWIFWPHIFEIVAFFLAATGLALALSSDRDDVMKAHWFFGAAFLLSLGRVAHMMLTWKAESNVRYLSSFALFGIIGLSWIVLYDWVDKKLENMLSPVQVEAVKEVSRFIDRDENGLRELFDFPSMIATNFDLVRLKIISFRKIGNTSFDLTPYLKNGGTVMLDTEIAGGNLRHQGGGGIYNPDPNQVALIILPPKYSESKKVLLRYENSSELPSTVISAVKDFDAAVHENAKTLVRVLNDALKQSPDNYLHANDAGSPYFFAVNHMYLKRFIELRPKADKVRDAIRKSLR